MKFISSTVLAAMALSCSSLAAVAQEQSYVDDRSDGPALIRSLYNAINRQEYARAYSYFGDQKPPAIIRPSCGAMPRLWTFR